MDDLNSFVLKNKNSSRIASVPISTIVFPVHSIQNKHNRNIKLIIGVNGPSISGGSRITPKEAGVVGCASLLFSQIFLKTD